MNDTKPMIWNINASLFESEQNVRKLTHLVATLRRQLAAEQMAYRQLHSVLLNFNENLRNYADSLSRAAITQRKNGTQ